MNTVSSILKFIAGRLTDIQGGRVVIGSVAANSYADTNVTFPKAYSDTPQVVVGLESSSTSPTMGSFQVCPINVTTTGFTIRTFNDTTSARTPAARWIAIP